MKEETKSIIHLHLEILRKTLKEENVAMAIQINKADYQKSKLCFLDYSEFKKGNENGITVNLEDFNSHLN